MPNTYFTNRIAPMDELQKVLTVSAAHGDEGIFFCTPKRVASRGLSRMMIRWKSPKSNSCVYISARILEIVDADSPEGVEYRQNLHARPWSDLSDHQRGSVIRLTGLRMVEPPPSVENLRHIQSCKYITL